MVYEIRGADEIACSGCPRHLEIKKLYGSSADVA
jgi:hypothetical protein